ncbi:uncharacterized protein ACLA_035120 [Aspergillus clavatus NRRL 1]|uniref:Uncharacterized protein n=1 Tax=Aspergillus clavatus (strain ATCC 1007 / CBS 513.65 / DSM 816 / NCTC 3887 / NRRL 1 / QM 1276 / 107) TaxID=344612 RepID=A1CJI5_ASPCL|nr:uncharacterized protein ACLA_035120 [Aspergillus clavatus NRRL 1]EAW09309.1 hypothetical protein ACLA_035120 [Aspergillus clavatus NRRL 1]
MGDNYVMIRVRYEEDRKPSLSALDEDLQPSQRTVEISPEPEYGPKRPIPDHLADILEEWHRERKGLPPCGSYNSSRPVQQWKVFDRQGRQIQLSKYDIISPCTYSVLVLHPSDSPEMLVRSRLPHGSKHGTYLVAWLGLSKGYEAQCCAIRMFASSTKEIVYTQEVWNNNFPDLDPEGQGLKTSLSKAISQTQPQDRGRERERGQAQKKRSEQMKERALRNSRAVRNRADAGNSLESPDEFSDTASSSSEEEEEEEEEIVAASTAKKRKLQHQSSNAPVKSPRTTNSAKVTVKLVSYKSGAIRAFPLKECKTGKDLFHKAQTFFRLFDRDVEVKILSCQISPERMQHYLFDGSEGEFDLLVERAKGISSTDDGLVTIEVNHVLGL